MSRRPFTPKVVTANALLEGDVVWLKEDDTWTRDIAEAELIEDEAVAQDRLIFAMSQFDTVVGAYLADVKATAKGPAPTHFREAFRAGTVTVRGRFGARRACGTAVATRPRSVLAALAQQAVGFGGFMEAFARFSRVVVAVRVPLHRHAPVGALDVVARRVVIHAENGIGVHGESGRKGGAKAGSSHEWEV